MIQFTHTPMRLNKIIFLLMLSDVFAVTGFGLIDPILAIYFKENLVGGTIAAAGIASTIFLVTKSLLQLPFSRYVDKHDDKIRWLIVGMALISTVPFIYLAADHIYTIYITQVIYGMGAALAFPTWLGLWSTHLDKKHESFEWSLYSTLTGLGSALTAAVGAIIADRFGFHTTFLLVGAMSMFGLLILLRLQTLQDKPRKTPARHYHKKRKLCRNCGHS